MLLEDSLFFGDARYLAKFHKQKLWLHRATMKGFELSLGDQGFSTRYVAYKADADLGTQLKKLGKTSKILLCEPTDFILEKRLHRFANEHDVEIEMLPTPNFLNTRELNAEYRGGKKRWFMAEFYKFQRKRLNILMDGDEPFGGKWSFDGDNRKKVPKKLLGECPALPKVKREEVDEEARDYVEKHFANHPGSIEELIYPTTHKAAASWLDKFLSQRFELFGDYEDAIVEGECWLWHSVLTPMLNVGLLTPQQIVDRTLKYAANQEVPLNSLEGFIRQILSLIHI